MRVAARITFAFGVVILAAVAAGLVISRISPIGSSPMLGAL